MLLTTQARPSPTANRANFPISVPVPSFIKEQYQLSFNSSSYSPFDPSQVEQVAEQLLDFATERVLYDSYHTFVLTVLPDYPDFKLNPSDPLDSAMLTAYSEGFYYKNFTELLWLIRDWQQIKLDYDNTRLVSLLQTLYEWGITHAGQFSDACQEVFTRYMQSSPASTGYAFIMACFELDLPLEHWIAREPAEFRTAFGSDFPVAQGTRDEALASAIRQDLAALHGASLIKNEVA